MHFYSACLSALSSATTVPDRQYAHSSTLAVGGYDNRILGEVTHEVGIDEQKRPLCGGHTQEVTSESRSCGTLEENVFALTLALPT